MRRRLGVGPSVALAALGGAVLAILPYFGVGPDTSPDADTYLERRYGNIGLGLTAMWLALMATMFVVGLVLTIIKVVRNSRRDDRPVFYHGTRADLQLGDLIAPGYRSNFGSNRQANHVYLTATVDAAVWGAELAKGVGPGRIYIVEPTGPIEDDPNLTDKKFPGNPTKSYRSRQPLRVTGEVLEWQGHAPDVLQAMKDQVERLRQMGVEAIDD